MIITELTPAQMGQRAEENFRKGYNCAQSVLCAYAELLGLEEKTAAMLASGFGGGVSRLRELCGAFSAGVMILGMTEGYDAPEEREGKIALYKRVQELANRFRAEAGSLICRELLELPAETCDAVPSLRTDTYYDTRPCPALCRLGARAVGEMVLKKAP